MQKGMVAAVIAAVALLACAGLAAADLNVGMYGTSLTATNAVEFEHYTINDYVTGPWGGPNVRVPYQLSVTRVGVEVTVSMVSEVAASCNPASPVVAAVITQLPQRFRPALTQRPLYFANANGRPQMARLDITPDGWLYFYADIDGSAWATAGVGGECRIYSWTANWRVA